MGWDPRPANHDEALTHVADSLRAAHGILCAGNSEVGGVILRHEAAPRERAGTVRPLSPRDAGECPQPPHRPAMRRLWGRASDGAERMAPARFRHADRRHGRKARRKSALRCNRPAGSRRLMPARGQIARFRFVGRRPRKTPPSVRPPVSHYGARQYVTNHRRTPLSKPADITLHPGRSMAPARRKAGPRL